MSIMKKIFNQTRKPEGILGRMMVNSMNAGHASMAAWGTGKLPEIAPETVIDLGCGGGKNAEVLLRRYPESRVTAVDYSEVSVGMTEKRNAEKIAEGRCRVMQGDVSDLSLEDGAFDLATAFETVYFWPGPVKSFREVFRILRKGGLFLIVNESDGLNEKDQKWVDIIDGMTIYREEEMVAHLEEAGFTDIRVFNDRARHWIAFLSHKA